MDRTECLEAARVGSRRIGTIAARHVRHNAVGAPLQAGVRGCRRQRARCARRAG
jgi:hypothetical protein